MSKCLLVIPLEREGRLLLPGMQTRGYAVEANLVIANNNIWKNRREQAIDIIG